MWGIYKLEEKMEAKRQEIEAEKQELEQRIENSLLTQMIKSVLMEKFGSLDDENVQKLRVLSREKKKGSCILTVDCDGFYFSLKNGYDETEDSWGMCFDAMDYEDLSVDGAEILKQIMLDTLSEIPHLTVWDDGLIMYNADRPKHAW